MGWERSLLESAAACLAERFRTRELGGGIDLQRVLVVVPGRRFGRELLAELVGIGEKTDVWVSPGRIVTPSEVCTALMGSRLRGASGLARSLAWGRVLREASVSDFELLLRRRPADEASAEWLRLGLAIDGTVGELAREMVLPGEVPEKCEALKEIGDTRKWEFIDRLRDQYESLLESVGSFDSHLAQLKGLRKARPLPDIGLRDVVLVGVVELDLAARTAIERSGLRAASLIFGPESESRWLDPFGCVRGNVGRDLISLRGDSLEFAPELAEGARRAVGRIAAWTSERNGLSSREVSVCAPAPEIALELQLASRSVEGLHFHDASGDPIGRSSVARFLVSACEHLREGTAESLAKFVKRPEVERWIMSTLKPSLPWLAELDAIAVASPAKPASSLADESGRVANAAAELIGRLGADSAVRCDLAAHLDDVVDLLDRAFGRQSLPAHDMEALGVVADAMAEIRKGDEFIGPVSSWRTIELLLEAIRDARTPVQSRRGEVEVLGWLEAAVDRSPYVAIFGLNEGFIPRGRIEDSLLPDPVRAGLGMATSRTQAERDAFLLEGIVRSREQRGGVWAICAGQDSEGNPLRPSRLLFRCEDSEAFGRIERMVGDNPESARYVAIGRMPEAGSGGCRDGFPLAPVHEMEPPKSVRATAFRDYIRSPYVFFLKHVARLEEIDEPAPEADHSLMGTLLHRVVADFGGSDAKSLNQESEIAAWALERFANLINDLPARRASVVREVQIEIAKRRLLAFAREQSIHVASGWSIHATEWVTPKPVEIAAPSGRIRLSGRIDRIDRRGDEWLVLDYKTGDTAKTPDKTHINRKKWVDLQLPLYAYMLRASGIAPQGARMAYFVLPKTGADSGVLFARWDGAALSEADSLATKIVESILRGQYPLGDDPFEEGAIARLCGVTLIESENEEGEE